MFELGLSSKSFENLLEKKNKQITFFFEGISARENKNIMDDVITKTQVVLNFL